MMLFHKNYTKKVMKSQNHEVIPYKFYQKFLEISQSWHYSIQILSKMSWNLKIKILFHTNSTKNVMKCHEITQLWRYSIQILPKMSRNPKFKTLFHSNSTKNVMKYYEVTQLWRYSIQIQPKNVMKSQNHHIIQYKLYQKRNEV